MIKLKHEPLLLLRYSFAAGGLRRPPNAHPRRGCPANRNSQRHASAGCCDCTADNSSHADARPEISASASYRCARIEAVKSAAPEEDFAAAWAKRDTRFIGVYGLTLVLPGVAESRQFELIDKYGVSPIEGTTDYIFSPQVARLNSLASRYATRYNQLLLEKLDERCKS